MHCARQWTCPNRPLMFITNIYIYIYNIYTVKFRNITNHLDKKSPKTNKRRSGDAAHIEDDIYSHLNILFFTMMLFCTS